MVDFMESYDTSKVLQGKDIELNDLFEKTDELIKLARKQSNLNYYKSRSSTNKLLQKKLLKIITDKEVDCPLDKLIQLRNNLNAVKWPNFIYTVTKNKTTNQKHHVKVGGCTSLRQAQDKLRLSRTAL